MVLAGLTRVDEKTEVEGVWSLSLSVDELALGVRVPGAAPAIWDHPHQWTDEQTRVPALSPDA